jgi:peptidyl-prolyl cis-trans isomerase D
MSVIQNIRDKYARIAVIAIALALLGFIAMDAFTGQRGLFGGGGPSTTVGTVNGQKIGYEEFSRTVQLQEKIYTDQGYPSSEAMRQNVMDKVWNDQVTKLLISSEVSKLGMTITDKELNNSILFGNNPPEDLKKQFTDPATGQYNAQLAAQQIKAFLKSATKDQKASFYESLDQLELNRMMEKYMSMMANSANTPRWILEKQNAENGQIARVTFTRKLYADIPDTTIKVSNQEIADYINKHKDEFKQEESRSISYVSFSALPSAADTAATRNRLETLKNEFTAAADPDAFIARTASAPNKSIYTGKSQMQMTVKDTLQALPVGGVFGPYLDGGSYALAKMLDVKTLPDSVKCRHVLVSNNPQQGGVEDSIASKRIDSIIAAIQGGANWGAMVQQYNPESDGSRQNNGEMTFSSVQIQDVNFAPEFGQFILFDGKTGERKKVKTSFGYHYIEIMSRIKEEPHYKIAYLFEPILASDETDQKAKSDASSFASSARDEKSFNETFEKNWQPKGYNKGLGYDIIPTAYEVMGLAPSRDFIRKIYDAEKGEVLQPERVGDAYVVAVVTEVNEAGTMSPAKARIRIEPLLRNKKKAELIIKDLGTVTTVEAAAAKWGKQVETVDSVRIGRGGNPTLASEAKVIGAVFNPANTGKVITQALEGASGVFVVRPESISATPVTDANVAEQRKQLYQQAKQQMMYASPLEAIRQAATIKDNRAKHF